MIALLTIYLEGDQMKKTEIGRACSTCWGGKVRFVGTLREGGNLKDPGIDGETILKWILEKWDCGGMD